MQDLNNIDNLRICNICDKRNTGLSEHCTEICGHGKYHYKDDCSGIEKCSLHLSGDSVEVKCRKLRKKELKEIGVL